MDGTKFSSIHLPLRKTFQEENFGYPWTYFFTEVPEDVSSRNIRIEIVSNTSIEYELYARLGGLPSVEVYDYYYANQSSNSNNGLSLFKVYVSSNQRVKFDIINAQEGNWSFGLIRRQNSMINSVSQTNLSISRESCPDDCSGYGKCSDISALTSYRLAYIYICLSFIHFCYTKLFCISFPEFLNCSFSFCRCDEFHGGFDCSIEIVPKSGRDQIHKFSPLILFLFYLLSPFPDKKKNWNLLQNRRSRYHF